MTIQLSLATRAWIITVVLAGIGILATSSAAQAQDPVSLVDRDALTVTLANETAADEVKADEVTQVGFSKRLKDSSCDTACDGCGEASCCCKPWWAHRTGGFGQFLLLRPGSVDQIYTIEQNDSIPASFPTGPVGRINIDEEPGYRVGLTCAASDCTSLVATYTNFEGRTSDQITAQAGNFLNSQIIHPSTLTVGAASLQGSADYSLDFQLIDLAYRHIWKTSDSYAVNWLAGFRYGNMEQDFTARQDVSVATGLVTVNTDIDFNGFGMLFGLDGVRRSSASGLMIYGRGISSFLAGDWTGDYVQTSQLGGGIVANDYEDYRVTPVVELELGFGWQSKCGRCQATVGYMTSAWYDAISNRQYVEAVRNDNYVSVDETITFSGLTAGIEARF